jgi:hypothetical protein
MPRAKTMIILIALQNSREFCVLLQGDHVDRLERLAKCSGFLMVRRAATSLMIDRLGEDCRWRRIIAGSVRWSEGPKGGPPIGTTSDREFATNCCLASILRRTKK